MHRECIVSDRIPSIYGNGLLSGAWVGESIGKQAQFGTEQRRGFRDYFTAYLPGSSLHPDPPPPKTKKPGQEGGKDGENDRATTTVRIPLRSAKHHFGATRARGTRPQNEDNYQAGVIEIPPFSQVRDTDPRPVGVVPGHEPSVFYYAVFDGHGGDAASVFLKDYLHRYIEESSKLFNPSNKIRSAVLPEEPRPSRAEETDEQRAGREKRAEMQMDLVNTWKDVGGYFRRFKPDFGGLRGCGFRDGDGGIEAVLMYAFLRADHDFITGTRPWFLPAEEGSQTPAPPPGEKMTKFKGGSTASIVLLSPFTSQPYWHPSQTSTIVTAHLGDTRALLCRVSDGLASPLTTNHHPSSPSESARLRRYATAFVSDAFGEERFGILANTRAVGDVGQKRLGVTAEPDINARRLAPGEYAFAVLVSDGISAVLGDQEIVDIVKECSTPEEAARDLVEFVDEVGEVGDNATALVIRLGGWEKRCEGGEGWQGTKALREWRRNEADERGGRGRRM
ncbi:phosphatase 2C-like domain-containing protein [Tricharina praecox]|uniref:phosphatase 2C-like domain-containing protein n=1 Tax=Tricharina praecox TaxID=43433 RepID=UPI00221ED3F2|nr:phosphatase 2C-like domain-containing protein [Tricharina praecox]KAI5843146.1 phosphatase 2C-like domain-containing protein [Tricharina praecox]